MGEKPINNASEEQKIQDSYRARAFARGFGSIICGGILFFFSVYNWGLKSSSIEENYIKNTTIFNTYHQAQNTLQVLHSEKDNLKSIASNGLYKPETIQPYISEVFGNVENKINSLDNAIKEVEKDMKVMKNTNEYKVYEKMSSDSNYKLLYVGGGGVVLMISSLFLLPHDSRNKRKNEEIAALNSEESKNS